MSFIWKPWVRDGKTFVVLPEDEFLRLRERLEDAEDRAELDRAIAAEANAPTVSSDELRRQLGLPPR